MDLATEDAIFLLDRLYFECESLSGMITLLNAIRYLKGLDY